MSGKLSIVVTAAVFCFLAVDKALFRAPSVVADAYHAQVREAAASLPRAFGPWLGMDAAVPAGATRLLRPNVLISRRYTNIQTGEAVVFVFIQVQDARDLLGHYPPVCYPGQGWTLPLAEPRAWQCLDRPVEGTSYLFERQGVGDASSLVVDSFLLLPSGRTCRDMDSVESVARDRLRKWFGAAQMQLVYDSQIAPERRQQITQEFIGTSAQLVEAVSSGEDYVKQ